MFRKFGTFFWRITSVHMITYFVIGVLSMVLFSYAESHETGDLSTLMKPVTSPWVMAGPVLQVFRGLLFSVVLWPFRETFLTGKSGWLKLWGLFLGLAILGTAGPTPGSFEGMIYTNFPVLGQIIGLRETVVQTFLFSILVVLWYKYPKKIWTIVSIILTTLLVLMITAGLLTRF